VTVDAFAVDRTKMTDGGVESPGWWVQQLDRSMQRKRPLLQLLQSYDEGNAPLMDIAPTVREAYLAFQKRARTNFASLVVDAMIDRIQVAGIRTGAGADEYGDQLAWDWWQANELDADANVLHRSVFVMGEAYAIAGDLDPDTGVPVVTVEDPRQMAVATDPLRRRRVRAALKRFTDEWTGLDHAYLYLRGEQGGPALVFRAENSKRRGWEWLGEPQRLPFSQAPVVWFPNQLSIDGRKVFGEFQKHIDVLDRINSTVLQRIVTGAMQAFRQRILKNLPTHDKDGVEIDYEGMFAADPAALWNLPEGVDVWESQVTDLTPMLMAARDDIKDLAAVTRTPLPSLMPDGANQSAANSELVESGLIFKAIDRMTALSEPWEQLQQLQFLWAGDVERAARRDMEILWMPPSIPSMAERFDAASKAQAAGLPDAYIRRNVLGMTPQEIARYAAEPAAQTQEPSGS
jgi:hypothetical protein